MVVPGRQAQQLFNMQAHSKALEFTT
ncbi:hypothetical protein AERO8C_120224 [Aeromonas veronii]|uniref:Uncharacterized protein n=1 Tax=Aeromonas veronii TaxID=654 RepID=A0A653KRL0_AERVE|nr:hypothetical protein AERO8C_120224 [Aeromonas veronii]